MSSVLSYVQKLLLSSRQRNRSIAPVALAALLLSSGSALAIEVEAGDYTALPAGTNLGLLYYQYATKNSNL